MAGTTATVTWPWAPPTRTLFDGDPSTLTEAKKKELGFNDSALHWDLVNTEPKTVTAHLKSGDRVVVYEDGMFKMLMSHA